MGPAGNNVLGGLRRVPPETKEVAMPQVRLEVEGRRYFMSGDTVKVGKPGQEVVGIVSDEAVPVLMPDGTVALAPRDEVEHLD
jgi:hypothetical protein